jgi:hypothetical protein
MKKISELLRLSVKDFILLFFSYNNKVKLFHERIVSNIEEIKNTTVGVETDHSLLYSPDRMSETTSDELIQ